MFKQFCAYAAFFLLWLLTTQAAYFKYFTTWTLYTQFFYFVSEFHHGKQVPTYFQNITFAPSVFLFVYWPLQYFLKWNFSLLVAILIHGINILLVLVATRWSFKLEMRFVWYQYAFALSYLMFATAYTALGHTIYQTDFFHSDLATVYNILVILVVCPCIQFAGVTLLKPTIVKTYIAV